MRMRLDIKKIFKIRMNKYVCTYELFSIFAGDGYGPKNQNRFIAKKRKHNHKKEIEQY